MSTSIHSVLIMPGSTAYFFCKDGLSPLEVLRIKQVLNFGGNMRFINCGVKNEFTLIHESDIMMWRVWQLEKDAQVKQDFWKASLEDDKLNKKFK